MKQTTTMGTAKALANTMSVNYTKSQIRDLEDQIWSLNVELSSYGSVYPETVQCAMENRIRTLKKQVKYLRAQSTAC